MKKPRLPTVEELALWQEANGGTRRRVVSRQSFVVSEDALVANDAGSVPPPVGGRLGGGRSGHTGSYPSSPRVLGTPPLALPAIPPPQPSPSGGGSKAPLKPLAAREAKRVFTSTVEVTLDLHGLSKLDAYARVQQCIMRAHCARRRHVLIITGKGRAGEVGVLRRNLPDWLNEPALRPLISAFAHARAEKGGEGVTHVLVKRGEW